MWAWFYLPDRLPKEYNKWIGEVAQVDHRLIEILRKARDGNLIYGQDKGEDARLLQKMCKDYDWPLQWGDPETMIPIPCEVVHMGTGSNCQWHALVRFTRTFRFFLATHLPLQLLAKFISRRRLTRKIIGQACKDAVRSSAFLGATYVHWAKSFQLQDYLATDVGLGTMRSGCLFFMRVVDIDRGQEKEAGVGDVCSSPSIGDTITQEV
ncbi:MAG: hypothetical protein Q9217_000797 [Psora testacea]